MKSKDLNWENMTREIELPPYEEWEYLPTPEELDEHYNQIMKGVTNDNDTI